MLTLIWCCIPDIVNKVANRVVESNVRVENEDHLNIITGIYLLYLITILYQSFFKVCRRKIL